MSAKMKKQIAKVNALSDSLDELEKTLEPLFSKPLPETLSSLDALQQAKLQVVLPYLINDLIFIYLKTRGIDPKTHPVFAELDRVRQYFGKIKDAEESNKKRTTEVDKAAAGRFIKHAISEARQSSAAAAQPKASEAGPSNAPSQQHPSTSTFVPIRITDKMREREEYQRRLAEESDSEEADLEVIDGVTEEKVSELRVTKGKGKEVVSQEAEVEVTQIAQDSSAVQPESHHKRKKRKRPMDPFGPSEDTPVPSPSDKPKKGKKKKKAASAVDIDPAADSRANSDPDASKKESKSKKKKVKG